MSKVRISSNSLPIPYTEYTVSHKGDHIKFYLSKEESRTRKLPLLVWIQGSGCHSLFRRETKGKNKGKILGGQQNLLRDILKGRAHVMAVEKSGVSYLDSPISGGTAKNCTDVFLREHTLEKWANRISVAISSICKMHLVNENKIAIIGHSEGGATAALVAVMNHKVKVVAILSATGGTQLYDLILNARKKGREQGKSDRMINLETKKIISKYKQILTDPNSIERFAWGHPFRRWSSFICHSTAEDLMLSGAKIYIAHGTNDKVVPIESADCLIAELFRRGRTNIVINYLPDADHSLAKAEQEHFEAQKKVFASFIRWWLG
jgi:predicted esterase